MPRIPDIVLHSTVYLYDSPESARDGVSQGGSGLLCSLGSIAAEGFEYLYVVTNDHVICQGYTTVRAIAVNGEIGVFPVAVENWMSCPGGDDLAMAAIDIPPNRYAALNLDACLSRESFAAVEIGIGDDVFMASRLLDFQGREHNEPIARFGTVAVRGTVNLHQKERSHGQESIILEMHSICGHSGSPVYVMLPKTRISGRPRIREEGIQLIGIDWGHLPGNNLDVYEGGKAKKGCYARGASALAAAVPSWKILEMLDMPEFKERRDVADAQEKRRRETTVTAAMNSKPPELREATAITKEGFMNELKKASKKLEA